MQTQFAWQTATHRGGDARVLRGAAVPSDVDALNRRRYRVVRVPAGELLQDKYNTRRVSAGWERTERPARWVEGDLKKKDIPPY